MVRNAKIHPEDHSLCQNFVKDYPDPLQNYFKMILQVEIGGIKKRARKKTHFEEICVEKYQTALTMCM